MYIMQNNLSQQSKDTINSLWKFKTALNQIMSIDLADYIIKLIAKDQAHQKFLELTKD